MAVESPKPSQRGRETYCLVPLRKRGCVRVRGAQVVVLRPEPVEPRTLVGAGQFVVGSLRDAKEVVEMRPARFICATAFLEPAQRVLTDRVQHPEPRLTGHRPMKQAVVHERADAVEEVRRLAAHRLGSFERKSTRENS